MIDCPDIRKLVNFEEKFGGTLGICEGLCGWAYTKKDKIYPLPETMNDEQLLEIMKKSIEEDHDYLFESLQSTTKPVKYHPDLIY